jgi:myosin heavy subunit
MKELTTKVKASEKIDSLDPHVFLIAGAAYNKLRIGDRNQAIVISGESGAGRPKMRSTVWRFSLA